MSATHVQVGAKPPAGVLAFQGLYAPLPAAPSLSPAMSPAEQALLRAAAEPARRMLEFGCGGSTTLLLEASAGKLLSIDSDKAWLARTAEEPIAAQALARRRMTQWHADIGPTGDWGWPLQAPTAETAWHYWGAPWLAMPQADLVLVDGRYRVACALAAHGRVAKGGHVAVHDYWPRRSYQQALEPFFEVVGSAGNLVLLAALPTEAAKLDHALAVAAADPR